MEVCRYKIENGRTINFQPIISKKMKYTFLIILFQFYYCAYSQQISGELKNYPSTQFMLRYSPDGIILKEEAVQVNEEGRFQHKLTMKFPAIVIIGFTDYITQYIFMAPGLQLFVNADLKDENEYASSLLLSGNAARYNNYFVKLNSSDRFNAYDVQQHYDSILKLPEAQFIDFTNRFLIIRDSIRKYFFRTMVKDEQAKYFSRTDSIHSQYNVMYWTIKYAQDKSEADKKIFFDRYVVTVMKPLSEPAATTNYWFRFAWMWHLGYLYQEAKRKSDIAWDPSLLGIEKMYAISEQIGSAGFFQSLYGSYAIPNLVRGYSYITLAEFSRSDSAFKRMISKIKDPTAILQLEQLWMNERKKGMITRKGEPAPDFKVIDSSGNYHYLADFKGKILVIDVWSSYCGPCIKEFPYMHQLKDKFSNRENILFINISVDQNRKAWIEKGLRKVSPVGMCLWAENGDASNFNRDYIINAIPQVIVIDSDGRFIEYSAPFASWGDDLEKLIRMALTGG